MPQEHFARSREREHKYVLLVHGLPHADAWQERACSLHRVPSHRAPKSSVIICLRCHAGRCYKHILSIFHVHSAQALKAHLTDATSTRWHNLHKEMKAKYAEDYPQLKVRIRSGSGYDLAHRLSYYASNFAPIVPLNKAVSLGFYDTPNIETDVVSVPCSSVE